MIWALAKAQAEGLRYIFCADQAVAPDSQAAYAGPPGGFEPREEFGEVTFIFRLAGKASEAVSLAGSGTAPLEVGLVEARRGCADGDGTFAETAKIHGVRRVLIETGEPADSVARSLE